MKAKRVKKLDPAGPLAENAARIVRVRLRELRSFAPDALEPDAAREQHDMRIAAKRLRYVLEATEFCFGSAGTTARRRARDLQGVLGELHDCDVMLPRIDAHAGSLRRADAAAVRERAGDAEDLDPALSARARHRTAYRGLDVLSVHLAARRDLLFDRFTGLWTDQEKAGTWERLERAAERKLEEARERREAAARAAKAAAELVKAERAEREASERARLAAAELAEARRVGGRDAD
ncbi:MAG: CHAD domain-containing protein [Solirubrobacterales bacterium]